MEFNAETGRASSSGDLRPEDVYPKVLNAAAQCASKGQRFRDALQLYELLQATQRYSDPANSAALEEQIRVLRIELDGAP